MDNEDIKTYIGQLIANPDIGDIEKEIPIVKLLFLVYVAGLERKDFPIDSLRREIDIKKEIGARWHTFIGQLAILKSGYGMRGIDFIARNCEEFSNRLKEYFLPRK